MSKELFRLSEDEVALIQCYRHLSEDAKAAILSMAMDQAASAIEQRDNVIPLHRIAS